MPIVLILAHPDTAMPYEETFDEEGALAATKVLHLALALTPIEEVP